MTDSAGAVVARYEYNPFGELTAQQGNESTKYLFTGQEFDSESELVYMNARYYNPSLGRFLSRDPFPGRTGDLLSRNGYIYAKNNPLKYNDPTGEEEESVYITLEEEPELKIAGLGSAAGKAGGKILGPAGFLIDLFAPETALAPSPEMMSESIPQEQQVIGYKELPPGVQGPQEPIYLQSPGITPGFIGGIQKGGQDFGKLGKVVETKPGEITGYTKHGLEQKINRSVPTEIIKDTVRNPQAVLEQAGGSKLYLGDDAAVVLNKEGKVVTIYGKNFFKKTIKYVLKLIK